MYRDKVVSCQDTTFSGAVNIAGFYCNLPKQKEAEQAWALKPPCSVGAIPTPAVRTGSRYSQILSG